MSLPPEPPYDELRGHLHDRELLIQELMSLSRAPTWDEAKLEWEPYDAYWDENFTHCLCGHAIKERCVLRNRVTTCLARVGNCCVRQFMPEIAQLVTADGIFTSIRRVKKNPVKTLHRQLVRLAQERGAITAWGERWYLRHIRDRKLTFKELAYRRRLNRKILARPEDPEPTEDRRDFFCMPDGGPWDLDEALLTQALQQGRITEWEHKFYRDNYGKARCTEKQEPIKRRVEECALPRPWHLDEATLRAAHSRGLISSWDVQFYLSNVGQPRFSAKQAAVKWRIEDRAASA